LAMLPAVTKFDRRRSLCLAVFGGLWLLLSGFVCFAQQSDAESVKILRLTYRKKSVECKSLAEVIREYEDGSLLVQIPDGRLLSLDPEDVISQEPADQPMTPLTADQMIEELKEQLGSDFRFYKTKHYVIAFKTSQIYAEWVGQLFERFYRAFYTDWNNRDIKLDEPRFPLVAILFNDKNSYLEYAHQDIGDSAKAMIGYYNMNTNRMISYDLTGVDGLVPSNEKVSSRAVIERILSQPQAERTVATIVHEASHQLSYNAGLQIRLADNPLWLSEGLAMYFEAPDVLSPQTWKVGILNYHNLRLFLAYLNQRPVDSLQSLVSDDQKFSDPARVAAAYHESWALTYFLMKTRKKEFTQYMKHVAQFEPLAEPNARARLADFEKFFGPLAKLDRDFINYITRQR
jgi:Protein of unknown function (DUF1570)